MGGEEEGDVGLGDFELVFIHPRGGTSHGLENKAWSAEGRAHKVHEKNRKNKCVKWYLEQRDLPSD